MGQYDQSLLAGKVGEALPEARFNVLKDMISQPRPEVDAIKDIIGKPASGEEDATGLFAELSKIPGIQEQLSDFTYSVEEQGQDINASGWDHTSSSSNITISFWFRCSTNS